MRREAIMAGSIELKEYKRKGRLIDYLGPGNAEAFLIALDKQVDDIVDLMNDIIKVLQVKGIANG